MEQLLGNRIWFALCVLSFFLGMNISSIFLIRENPASLSQIQKTNQSATEIGFLTIGNSVVGRHMLTLEAMYKHKPFVDERSPRTYWKQLIHYSPPNNQWGQVWVGEGKSNGEFGLCLFQLEECRIQKITNGTMRGDRKLRDVFLEFQQNTDFDEYVVVVGGALWWVMQQNWYPPVKLAELLVTQIRSLLLVCNTTTNCRVVVFAELPTKAFDFPSQCSLQHCQVRYNDKKLKCSEECLNANLARFNGLVRQALNWTSEIEFVDLTWNVVHRMDETDLVHWTDSVRESNVQFMAQQLKLPLSHNLTLRGA